MSPILHQIPKIAWVQFDRAQLQGSMPFSNIEEGWNWQQAQLGLCQPKQQVRKFNQAHS